MRVVSDDDGRPTGLVSVSVDVSEQNRARRDLQAANSYLRAVTDSMAEGMFTLDSEGRTVYLNPTAERMLGWSNAEAIGRTMHELSHSPRPDGSPFPIEQCPISRARVEGRVVRVEDDTFRRKDGTYFPAAYTASPFSTAEGVEGCVVVMADISERKREEERIACDRDKLMWLRRVREALANESFELYAQPIVSCATGETVQRELLLRMHHPDLDGPAAPGSFLPVAEELGLVTEIDRRVITRAAEIAAAGEPVELNLSARSIADESLIGHIEHALAAAGANPRLLVFEITETAVLEDEAAARTFLERLHQLGCGIALDDFGTGYGTFTYLKQLPIDTVKIDIEFVRDLAESAASAKVVNAVLNVARDFGLKTIAEGVEDAETFELLRKLGVDYAQGFYIGRPAPLARDDSTE
jgi:PAS domain S-box-containing protein